MGGPEDFGNFINAVIDEKGFTSITNYIEQGKEEPNERDHRRWENTINRRGILLSRPSS